MASIYQNHLETAVLTAAPVELVRMLYRTAIDSVAAARRELRAGAIRERANQITRAEDILRELLRSLDRERGGEIARSLAHLYAYMLDRLIEGNARQIDPPLEEVERLLSTLLDGWSAEA